MTNIILTDPNADVIVIDPEREYPEYCRELSAQKKQPEYVR